jgi:hypothetical protein
MVLTKLSLQCCFRKKFQLMRRKLVSAFTLIIFVFGLIPGEYWKILHHHHHYSVVHSHKLTFSEKHKTCTNDSHLYDYIPTSEVIKQTVTDQILVLLTGTVKHLPHSSFLNNFLRAPPFSNS